MDVPAGDAHDRREQVVDAFLGYARGDFCAETSGLGRLVHDHAAAGFLYRFGDRVEVERRQCGEVDHFGADAFFRQRAGGFQGFLDLCAPGDEGDVGAVAQHEAHVQRQRFAIIRHFFLVLTIDALGFVKDDRIRVADRGKQQAVGARRRGWQHHAQAGHVREQVLVRFRMMFGRVDAATPRCAKHGRAGDASARAVAHARGVAANLLHHRVDETFELRFANGLHALRGKADGEAGDGGFVQRRVEHAPFAEFFRQALRGAEHAAVDADVFAKHDHGRVALHLVSQRLGDAFDKCDRRHQCAPLSSAIASARCLARSAGSSAKV